MTWKPITKEICWCQEKHPMGSVCGCWSCPDCGRFYGCNAAYTPDFVSLPTSFDLKNVYPLGNFKIFGIEDEPEYYI